MSTKENTLYPPGQLLAVKQSSLFSRESFHEDQMKKREGNRSVIALAQEPEEQVAATKPKVLYENTYKLQPERKFHSSAAQRVINEQLETYLKSETYDPNASAQMTKTLAQIIKDAVKDLKYDRYKIVCVVTIGELLNGDVGIMQASRCVWDTNWDTFASGIYKNKTLYGVATVYAVYQE